MNERTNDYAPIDFNKYLDIFDFGGKEDTVKVSISKYEEKKMQDALIKIEYDLIYDNYSFDPDEFERAYKKTYSSNGKGISQYSVTKDSNGIFIVNADPAMWEGLSPEAACKNMKKIGIAEEAIAFVLINKMGCTQPETGNIINKHSVSLSSRTVEGDKKAAIRLLEKFKKNYHPF